MQKYHDEPRQYKGYLKSALASGGCYWAGGIESYRESRRAHSLRGWSPWHGQVDIPLRYESGPV